MPRPGLVAKSSGFLPEPWNSLRIEIHGNCEILGKPGYWRIKTNGTVIINPSLPAPSESLQKYAAPQLAQRTSFFKKVREHALGIILGEMVLKLLDRLILAAHQSEPSLHALFARFIL